MPRIREYDQQTSAQGSIAGIGGRRADALDFGADFTVVGDAMQKVGAILEERQANDEVTQVHVDMSKAKADWSQNLIERSKNASPTDKGFAPTLQQDMSAYFEQMSGNYKTRKAQELFRRMAAEETAGFTVKAAGVQAHMAGEAAKTNYLTAKENLGRTVFNDPTAYGGALASGEALIDTFQVDGATKAELKRQLANELDLATMKGLVGKPGGAAMVLGKVAPEVLKQFKPVGNAIDATLAMPTSVLRYSETIKQNAAQYGVSSSIMAAQLAAESSGNPRAMNMADAAKTGSPSMGIAQFQPETAARYGIDPMKPDEAIKGQAAYMSDLLKMFGGDYEKALAGYNWGEGNVKKAEAKYGADWKAHAPKSTQEYIDKIMRNSGAVVGGQVELPTDGQPAKIGIQAFDNLGWREQYEIIHNAEQTLRMEETRSNHARAEAERIRKEAQEGKLNEYYNKLLENKLTVDDIKNDTVLTFSQREHMVNAINTKTAKQDNTDPATFIQTYNDIHAGKITDPDQVRAFMGKGLGFADINKLIGEIEGKKTPQGQAKAGFFKMAEAQISKSSMIAKDPEGEAQFYRWTQYVEQVIAEKQKAGVPLSEMLKEDGRESLWPTIRQFTRTPQQQIQDQASRMRGQPAQPPKKSLDDIFNGK